mgnify:CR=1 FL=1
MTEMNTAPQLAPRERCTGCAACCNGCPKGAIRMVPDREGFLYPQVTDGCVQCGHCTHICPVLKQREPRTEPAAFIVWNGDEAVRRNSTAGGAFSALAEYVLEGGGVVFGAAFDKDFAVRHICAPNAGELPLLFGSKYVQSDTTGLFETVKQFLDSDRQVLFSGTPCQVAGLKKSLGKNYPNLLTVDLVCHGVPSPAAWQKYLDFTKKKYSAEPCSVNFRSKVSGWKKYSVEILFKNGKTMREGVADNLYMKAFLRNLSLRPSCYNCPFKGLERVSDITLADFWGVEHVCPDLDDGLGTSLVLVNSKRGLSSFEKLGSRVRVAETAVSEAVKYNSAAVKSVARPENRDEFFRILQCGGFGKEMHRFLAEPFSVRLKKSLKKAVKAVIGKK